MKESGWDRCLKKIFFSPVSSGEQGKVASPHCQTTLAHGDREWSSDIGKNVPRM